MTKCASLSLVSERKHWLAAPFPPPEPPGLVIIPERCEAPRPHRPLLGCQCSPQLLQVDLHHPLLLLSGPSISPAAPTSPTSPPSEWGQWQYENRDERGSYEWANPEAMKGISQLNKFGQFVYNPHYRAPLGSGRTHQHRLADSF